MALAAFMGTDLVYGNLFVLHFHTCRRQYMLSAPNVFSCLWKVCHGRGAPLAHPQEGRRAFNVSQRIENSKGGGTPASGETCEHGSSQRRARKRSSWPACAFLYLTIKKTQKTCPCYGVFGAISNDQRLTPGIRG